MDYSLGIDLGTTYSAAATAHDDRVEIFQLGERAATIPSIVVLRADGEVLTGDAAERRSLGEPTRTAREFKRRLGDPTPIILGGTPYGAEALLAHLLRAIVGRVSEQSGGPPAAIVVTHPASYGAYKIDLLEQAIRQADIEHVSLLTEPEAAAVYYAQQERVPVGAAIAVYDFGGGTFDATILRKTEAGFEQLGRPEGMERLGGIDFDEALFRRVMTMVQASGAVVDPNDPATLAAIARLREECRRAKEALSSDTDATISVVLPGLQTEMRLTREEFEEMIRPRITETIGALGRAVKSAGLEFGGIDRILLVGGSSRIPLVAEMVRDATGRPVAVDAHPKHSMALGAAYIAEERRRAAAGAAAGAAGVGVAGAAQDDEPVAAGALVGAAALGAVAAGGPAAEAEAGTTGGATPPPVVPAVAAADGVASERTAAWWSAARDGRRGGGAGRGRMMAVAGDRGHRAGRAARGRRVGDAIGWKRAVELAGRARLAERHAAGHADGEPEPGAERGADRDAAAHGHAGPDADTHAERPRRADHGDHRQRRQVRRQLQGLRLHAEASGDARPLLLRHRQAGRRRGPGQGTLEGVRDAEPVHPVPGHRPSRRREPDVHPGREPRPLGDPGHRQLRGPAVLTLA